MTTINTIEDLIRILDENPEWAGNSARPPANTGVAGTAREIR